MNEMRLLCTQYRFNPEAVLFLDSAYQQLANHNEAFAVFCRQIQLCEEELLFEHESVFAALHELQASCSLHPHTIDLLYLIRLLPLLEKRYKENGIPLRYYENFVYLLRKAAENSLSTCGFCSISTGWWLIDYYKMKLYSIGRLQFKRRKFKRPMGWFQPGQYYIDVHIPGGSPLTYESCRRAYDEAASFFQRKYGMEEIVFCCHSWLLSPDLDEFLPPHSNILAFAHDYTILETTVDPNSHAAVFVFGVSSMPDNIDELPGDTSLRRAFKERLKAGKTINVAFGAMTYNATQQEE